MAAGLASINACLAYGFYEQLESKTLMLVSRLKDHIDEKGYDMSVVTIGSIFWLAFTKERISSADQIDAKSMELFKKLHAYLLDHGVYLGPSGYEVGFVSQAHTSKTLDKAATIICAGIDHTYSS